MPKGTKLSHCHWGKLRATGQQDETTLFAIMICFVESIVPDKI